MEWKVQTGKGKGRYTQTFWFEGNERKATWYYNCINTHSGYKKRLVNPDGKVVARVIT